MANSIINVTFSASSLEGVNKYAELVNKNTKPIQCFHFGQEKVIETTEGPNGSYFLGMIQLVVADKDLNTTLVQLDAVEAGYVEGSIDVIDLVFGDMRAVVTPAAELSDAGIVQMNTYLHNKVQEQSKAIAILEFQLTALMEQSAEANARAKIAHERIDSIQAYLFNYIDLPGMAKVVRATAEAVDEDLMDNCSTTVKIH